MASLKEIHDALEVRLDTVSGLHTYAEPQQSAPFPKAFPYLQTWEPTAMGRAGWIALDFEIIVLTAESVRPEDGYRALLDFIDHEGASSIFLALWDGNDHAAGTFGGLADTQLDTSNPGAFRLLGLQEIDAFNGYGGAIAVRVITKG